jgi:hypothetical protein
VASYESYSNRWTDGSGVATGEATATGSLAEVTSLQEKLQQQVYWMCADVKPEPISEAEITVI